MLKIAVVGTGYVGLVTGVCLAEMGHHVVCIDIVKEKVATMKKGISPIYEPGLDELMTKNIDNGRLEFTTSHKEGFSEANVIMIAVGTPERPDGSADLSYIEQTAKDIANNINHDVIVVTKSTVPIGTNEYIYKLIQENLKKDVHVEMVSNPEFLREGSAIFDTFNGDRIVIGSENKEAASMIEKMYRPLNIPIFQTNLRSSEMIKYASNAFLATKISFINEMANFCEIIGANIDDVAVGMGKDRRIGHHFLNAGIGFGGSCFPKDTSALVKMANDQNKEFKILQSVIEVNHKQKVKLVQQAVDRLDNLKGKKIAILGLAFKPNTDDMREASSINIIEELEKHQANMIAYDPIAVPNARKLFHSKVLFANSIKETIEGADCVFILTEWKEFIEYDISLFSLLMKEPIIFDGRNCFDLEQVKQHNIEYYSIGRPTVYKK